ncbi:fimbrial biogenesis chaperone [Pantoea agglomerans]|uniref:Fimbria/pilus periplasmic chaperone n=1 Tax=Enterobacter agglomerans TaxID=549 RepID=A0AAN2K6Q7_ENTAG|nr:fimbria/pilus periplasmic chaperone [Pantoea agglomerans]MBN9930583.1 fimbria/pilus periplasmic chaperone [Pantoea agglomerans]NEG61283.1 fimbria/pilus periplasmic chaperone [Pantoea agglomerans]CAH6321000.1 fimbria/pilus periplasmic chaperone [Pantoea agglomerans]
MNYQRALFFTLMTSLLSLLFITQSVLAGMTISGTRIVFPGNEREHMVRTNNKSSSPLLVQVWVDDGTTNGDINKLKVPFTVTPPVYRVEPGKGQSVRLIYNGMTLPQDRESVFWFNMLEIPPVNESVADKDRLELAFRTRIKIFYRPSILKASALREFNSIKWQVISPAEGIKVTNPTPYYISFDSAYIVSGNTKSQLKSDMIPPFSTKEMLLDPKAPRPTSVNSVLVRVINDFGNVIEYQLVKSGGDNLSVRTDK